MPLNPNLGPHGGRVSAPPCHFHDTCGQHATFVAAQSTDCGATATWVLVCATHVSGWNDGGDWDAPVYEMVPAPGI